MEQKANSFLESERLGRLMAKYAVPCVISLLVAALYNIVDQIFIANADYLGSYGNAANTVVFPLTVVALSIAVMIGDGCCAFVSISLGAGNQEAARKSIGNAVLLCVISGLVLTVLYLAFQEPILTLFGGRVNEETFRHAKEYFFWITLGVPFYMFGQALNPIIRSDGSPKFAMASTLIGPARLPLIAATQRKALDLALRTCNAEDEAHPRVVWIPNTLHLNEIYVSEAVAADTAGRQDIRVASAFHPVEWSGRDELILK